MTFDLNAFTDDLRRYLHKNKLSYVKAAEITSVSRNWIFLTLKRSINKPNINNILALCELMNQNINNYIK